MVLQPVVMNAFAQDSTPIQPAASTFDNAANSPFLRVLEGAEQIGKIQDKRVSDDLKAHAKSRSSTAKMLNLLQLQYDLDDMQVSATIAKNIATQVGQALNTLTQRS